MSFSSFSTAILYNEQTVPSEIRQAARTADPYREILSDGLRDSYFYSYSKFSQSIHEFAKRKSKPENKTPASGTPSNSSNMAANKTSKALGSSKKHFDTASIAASSVFGAISVAAIAFLLILLVKKFRKRQLRKRGGIVDPMEEERRKRAALMFCKSTPREYVIEQEDGEVTRVLCTSNNACIHKFSSNSVTSNPLSLLAHTNSARDMESEPVYHLEQLSRTSTTLSGSVAKQIVVVSSPLRSVVSRSAISGSEPDELDEKLEPLPSSTVCSTQAEEHTEVTASPVNSFRRSLLRLPSIRQSLSPIFRF
ncbi:hypothetical protein BJX99DRAFT_233061 [Aspergillus californicus]